MSFFGVLNTEDPFCTLISLYLHIFYVNIYIYIDIMGFLGLNSQKHKNRPKNDI